MTIDPAELIFDQTGSDKQFSITSNSDWSITKTESWVTLSRSTGNGNAQITVTTAANDTPDERTATLTIKAGDKTKTLTVIQKQKDALTVTKSSFEVSADGEKITVEVKANIDYQYEIAEDSKSWITPSPSTRGLTTTTLQFDIAPNTVTETREGKITIKSGGISETITVTQAADSIFGDIPTVHVAQAGTLEAILTEKGLLGTTALKITGVLNNADVTTFKSMIAGTLRTLDISEAEVPNTFDLRKSQIEKIALPNAWTEIPDDFFNKSDAPFSSFRHLESVVIGDNVEKIGEHAFSGCINLASINIPEGVKSIGEDAFAACMSLASITIPEGVTSIENGVFDSCYSLESINIPAGVTSIGWDAFAGCGSLASITIPENVKSIGVRAFQYCNDLTSIIIPRSVTSIQLGAFEYCDKLSNVTCLAAIPPALSSDFYTFIGCDYNTLHVPSGSVAAYKANAVWSINFSSIVAIAE